MKIFRPHFAPCFAASCCRFAVVDGPEWLLRAFALRTTTSVDRVWAQYMGILAGISAGCEPLLHRNRCASIFTTGFTLAISRVRSGGSVSGGTPRNPHTENQPVSRQKNHSIEKRGRSAWELEHSLRFGHLQCVFLIGDVARRLTERVSCLPCGDLGTAVVVDGSRLK